MILFLVLLIVAFFYYLAQINPDTPITFFLSSGKRYSAPLVVQLIISFVSGAVLVLILSLADDLRKTMGTWRQRTMERAREKAASLFAEGERLTTEGNYKKAKEAFMEGLEREPASVVGLLGAAEVFRLRGETSQAMGYLSRARELSRRDMELTLRVVDGFRRIAATREAIDILRDLVADDSDNIRAQRRLAELYSQARMWKEACQAQREVVRLSGTNGRYREEEEALLILKYRYAQNQLAVGDGETALKLFREISKQDDKFLAAHVGTGDAHVLLGQPEEAGRVWERTYRNHGAMIFLLRLEELSLSRGEPEAALRVYRKAIEERPHLLLPGLFLGKLLLRLEMVDDALDHLSSLSAQGEDSYYFHMLLGEVYRRRNRHDQATAEFAKALGFKRKPTLPFVCSGCEKEYPDWDGICDSCGRANTIFARYERQESTQANPSG